VQKHIHTSQFDIRLQFTQIKIISKHISQHALTIVVVVPSFNSNLARARSNAAACRGTDVDDVRNDGGGVALCDALSNADAPSTDDDVATNDAGSGASLASHINQVKHRNSTITHIQVVLRIQACRVAYRANCHQAVSV